MSLRKIKDALIQHENVIVISPFINNNAIKGPSKKNFTDMGLTADIKGIKKFYKNIGNKYICLLYTSPSPRDVEESRMPSSA